MDLLKLGNIAMEAAAAAGAVIQQYMHKEVQVEEKAGGMSLASQVVTAVDRECEEVILSHLLPSCREFDLALLSEEKEDDGSRFEKDFFWCIDPMDGTFPFIEKRPGFSVSIALVAKDGTPQIGVVFDPTAKLLYHAVKGEGVYRNGESWKATCNNRYLTYVTDRKLSATPHAEDISFLLHKYSEKLGLDGFRELSGGGAVLNAIRVLEHGPACMLKLPKKERGGGSLWDFAATACIYQELGLPASSFGGGKLDLNRSDSSFMNHQGIFYANLGS